VGHKRPKIYTITIVRKLQMMLWISLANKRIFTTLWGKKQAWKNSGKLEIETKERMLLNNQSTP